MDGQTAPDLAERAVALDGVAQLSGGFAQVSSSWSEAPKKGGVGGGGPGEGGEGGITACGPLRRRLCSSRDARKASRSRRAEVSGR